MEQKIAGCWINLEGMNLEQLEFWAEVCQSAIIRAKEDLSRVEGEIAGRPREHVLDAEPPFGDPL